MIDSHAHIISEFYEDIDELVNKIKKQGIVSVINCGDSLKTSKEVIEICKKHHDILFPVVGIHPDNISDKENMISKLENIIISNKVYGIGEIGLDYYHNNENRTEQKELFSDQIDLANKYNLPIVVHTRDSIQDCFDILKTKKIKGIIHCYSGSVEMAKEFIKLGFFLGIGGVLTFKNSNLYKVIESIDLESIVLETDSPFLSPEPHRGTKNIPSNVYYVAKRISEIKHISIEEVINTTSNNVRKIFDI